MRLFLAFLAVAGASCASAPPVTGPVAAKPKNVILIIGDGMGPSHFVAARLFRGADYRIGKMPVTGVVSTHALNATAPDSASTATAYASGAAVNYGVISMDRSGRPLETALEVAEKTGRATGLVTTTNFWDATPAAFAAHAANRGETDTIIDQMLKSGAEVIVGGGKAKFDDSRGVAAGYSVVHSWDDLSTARGDRILGVFETQKNEIDFPEAPLPLLAAWAMERLARDPDGFFLLLENEGTDGSSHNNATDDFIASARSVDITAGVALDFAARHPGTLVIVTGDHETGGLQILPEKSLNVELRWGGKGHTAADLPIFAQGPGAERFLSFMTNDEVGRRLKALLSSD